MLRECLVWRVNSPVCPQENAIEAAQSGDYETSLIPEGRGSSKENLGVRSLDPTMPSGLWHQAFHAHKVTAFTKLFPRQF